MQPEVNVAQPAPLAGPPTKLLCYRLVRRLFRWILRPRIAAPVPQSLPDDSVYVLPLRSLSDLIVLDIVCAEQGLPDPLGAFAVGERIERRRFLFLARPAGWRRRNIMRDYSQRLQRLTADAEAAAAGVQLLPAQVFWGQAANRERSVVSNLLSENWAMTSRLRRLINLFLARRHILVRLGAPVPLAEAGEEDGHRRLRRCARLLRTQLHGQKAATLGPDLSHRRTLVDRVEKSAAVQAAIEQTLAEQRTAGPTAKTEGWLGAVGLRTLVRLFRRKERTSGGETEAAARQGQRGAPRSVQARQEAAARKRLQAQARRAALEIAANMSYPTILSLARLLGALFNRIYERLRTQGLEQVSSLAETHTLVYVPSHRSHMDYLLISLLLFDHGLMIPHIAAGDNLNLPLVGSLLRRCGAFFMRRSFRGDAVYAAVLGEYLHEVYRRGHSVEFFPEGGRSRTGRLLPARFGLLKMTLAQADRGLPRPIAFVPVYLGFEKLAEASTYVEELRGVHKRRESLRQVLGNIRLIRQRYGRVDLNFGRPLKLEDWRAQWSGPGDEAQALGREILERVNAAASINPVNLAATALLCAPRQVMEAARLAEQIDCCLDLLRLDAAHHDYRITTMEGTEIIDYLVRLGFLAREREAFGEVLAAEPATAVQLTWYRNNTAHALALPALLAFLIDARRRPLPQAALETMAATVFPYIAWELHAPFAAGDSRRWIGHLLKCGLIHQDEQRLRPPPADSPARHRLHLLADLIRQTLERQYIVLSLLTRQPPPSRADLKAQSRRIAHKMARLHGINAPEFFDQNLFDEFVDKLISDGVVAEGEDGRLSCGRLVEEVLRTANRLIDDEFRYAVMRE